MQDAVQPFHGKMYRHKMACKIEFDVRAAADFAKLDETVKKQIQKYINKIAEREDPRTLGEPLQENLSSFWKYRAGDYRLIAEIQNDVRMVIILVIDRRDKVYKIASKRLSK